MREEEEFLWECYLCANEYDFEDLPHGYLGNFHPLCKSCTNKVFRNQEHNDYYRLTYNKKVGDLVLLGGVLLPRDTNPKTMSN